MGIGTEPSVETTDTPTTTQSSVNTTGSTSSTAQPTETITLSLAVDDADLRDHLVITFAKNGALECPDMISEPSTSKLLYEIELKGQNVTEPSLMAIASEDGVARRVLLLLALRQTSVTTLYGSVLSRRRYKT
jgi:hypothetical protein